MKKWASAFGLKHVTISIPRSALLEVKVPVKEDHKPKKEEVQETVLSEVSQIIVFK